MKTISDVIILAVWSIGFAFIVPWYWKRNKVRSIIYLLIGIYIIWNTLQ